MNRHSLIFFCIIALTGLCSCEWDARFDYNITLKHPVQQLAEEAAKQEPSLETLLLDWGYPKEQIANPITAMSFQPDGEVRLTWIAKHTNKHIQIVWYQNEDAHPLLLTDNIMHIPTILQTKNDPFGLRINVLNEPPYSVDLDSGQNSGEQRVKVFTAMRDGIENDSSYILCWEVDNDNDFNDVIMRLEEVEVMLDK